MEAIYLFLYANDTNYTLKLTFFLRNLGSWLHLYRQGREFVTFSFVDCNQWIWSHDFCLFCFKYLGCKKCANSQYIINIFNCIKNLQHCILQQVCVVFSRRYNGQKHSSHDHVLVYPPIKRTALSVSCSSALLTLPYTSHSHFCLLLWHLLALLANIHLNYFLLFPTTVNSCDLPPLINPSTRASPSVPPHLKQPAVLVRAVSHSRCLGLQFSSPPPAPLLPCSQPECGTITSSERACNAWSTISILTESWEDKFHSVPEEENDNSCLLIIRGEF